MDLDRALGPFDPFRAGQIDLLLPRQLLGIPGEEIFELRLIRQQCEHGFPFQETGGTAIGKPLVSALNRLLVAAIDNGL